MDGTCLTGEGSFRGSERIRAEMGIGDDLMKDGWFVEVVSDPS